MPITEDMSMLNIRMRFADTVELTPVMYAMLTLHVFSHTKFPQDHLFPLSRVYYESFKIPQKKKERFLYYACDPLNTSQVDPAFWDYMNRVVTGKQRLLRRMELNQLVHKMRLKKPWRTMPKEMLRRLIWRAWALRKIKRDDITYLDFIDPENKWSLSPWFMHHADGQLVPTPILREKFLKEFDEFIIELKLDTLVI